MARPSKPVSVIQNENKSHRTKKELASRKQAESGMLSGAEISKFPETKADRKASKEFDRVTEILSAIGKNDRMYETIINRYCIMLSECRNIEKLKKEMEKNIKNLSKSFKENMLQATLTPEERAVLTSDFSKQICKLANTMLKYDKEIDKKRTMLLAIEKETGMTMAAALRTIPKQEEKETNALLQVLGGG